MRENAFSEITALDSHMSHENNIFAIYGSLCIDFPDSAVNTKNKLFIFLVCLIAGMISKAKVP